MAAGEVIKEFFITLGLEPDTASFATGTAAVRVLEISFRGLIGAARSVFNEFVEGVFSTSDYAREMQNFAAQAGMTTEKMEGVAYAIRLTGSTLTTLVGNLAQGLRMGGVTDMHKTLLDIAEQFETITDKAERVRLVTKYFGEEGRKLVPIFLHGRKGLEDIFNEIVPLTEEQIAQTDAFNLAWQRLTATLSLLRRETFIKLFPLLTRMADATRRTVLAIRDWIKTNWPEILKATKAAALLLAGVLGAQLVQAIWMAVTALNALTAAQVRYGLASLAAGVRAALAAGMALLPWVLVAAAIAIALDEFIAYVRGGKTAIGALSTMWDEWIKRVVEPVPGDSGLMTFFRELLKLLLKIGEVIDRVFKMSLVDILEKVTGTEQPNLRKTMADFKLPSFMAVPEGAPDNVSTGGGPVGWLERFTGASQPNLRKGPSEAPSVPEGERPPFSWRNPFRQPLPEVRGPASPYPAGMSPASQVTIDAPITVNAAPGMDTKQLAAEVAKQSEERWKAKMRQLYTGTPQ